MRKILLAGLVAGTATPALAHTGIGSADGFPHGFAHPFLGLDHVLAMVTVGLLAAQLGGRASWLVPGTFLTLMVAGGALGAAGLPLPFVETGIGLSVVAFGAAVALGLRMPVAAACALVGLFALFHGHAHGTEMPETASGLGYGAGFVLATAILHAVGLGAGLAAGRLASGTPLRLAGGLAALGGVAILAGAW